MKITAKKMGMTQIWKEDKVIPVTILKIENTDSKNVFDAVKDKSVVRASGKSKGKGFQGVVKRHGFKGGPKSHGQKDRHRAPGSIGATTPQRVLKGKKMPGRMGNKRITIKNLVIEEVQPKEKTLLVRGAIPGMKGTKVEIKTAE